VVITMAACKRLNIGTQQLLPFFARGWATSLLVTFGTFAGVELGTFVSNVFGAQLTVIAGGLGSTKVDIIVRVSQHLLPLACGSALGIGVLLVVLQLFPRLLGNQVLSMLARFSPRFVSKGQG